MEMQRMRFRLAIVVLSFVVGSCGGGGGSEDDVQVIPDLPRTEAGDIEVEAGELPGTLDIGGPDEELWVPTETTSHELPDVQDPDDLDAFVPPPDEVDEPDEVVIPAGQVGAACTGPAQCNFPLCLWSAGGQVCSATCDPLVAGSCPGGFKCLPFPGIEGSACVPTMGNLCRPCASNMDCYSNGVDTGDRCIGLGAKGNFCGGECTGGTACPAGYECHGIVDVQGKPSDQCLKPKKECECSERYMLESAYTTCYVQNVYGKCEGDRFCALTGLTACSAAVPAVEECNGKDDNCNGMIDEGAKDTDNDGIPDCNDEDIDGDNVANFADNCPLVSNSGQENKDQDSFGDVCDDDIDQDGDPNETDCAPYDSTRFHGQEEQCDGIDNDCSGGDLSDEADADGDGVRGCAGDCNDANGQVYPNAAETCATGYDDNCDGDENTPDSTNCQIFFKDADGDGYGVSDTQCLCFPSAPYIADNSDDCDDTDQDVRPGVMEDCSTPGVDENCDGNVNMVGGLNCTMFYLDADGDSYGVPESTCACEAAPPYNVDNVLDCNDFDASINPKAKETCLTIDLDDNCNGTSNDMNAVSCDPWFEDKDGDGFGMGQPVCICAPQSVYTAPNGEDCDDTNAQVFPGQSEQCSTDYDDNCDGDANEADSQGCTPYWVDQDGDGSAGTQICYCKKPANSQDFPEDCCDSDPLAFPTQTKFFSEPVNWCGGFDYNCDGNPEAQYNSSCVDPPCSAGWFQPAPGCGVAGNWCLNCAGCGSCIGQTIPQKQKCR